MALGNYKTQKTSVSRINLLVPRPMRLSLRNAFRRKVRLSLTLFTLVLGGAIFIAVNNLGASFDKVIEDFQGYYLADVTISFDRSYRLDKVAAMAKKCARCGRRGRLVGIHRKTHSQQR